MNYKTYESVTRVITALVVYEYHYALNYMVKSHQYYISSMFIRLQLGLRLFGGRGFIGVTSSCLVWWAWLRRCDFLLPVQMP